MSDRAYAKAQAQQKTLTGSSPKSSLLQRTCACGQHTIAGGECSACRSEQSTLLRSQRTLEPPSAPGPVPGSSSAQENGPSLNSAFDRASRFGHDFSRIPIHTMQTTVPQTKLKVNQPGDVYEQEADQVSEQVMHMANLKSSLSDGKGEAKNSLMCKQSGESETDRATGTPSVPPIVHEVLNSGGGQPLDTATRAFMEPSFGHDFSRVRIHSDARAAESANAVNALAYTVGTNVVFGTGQYAPSTSVGMKVLAHELAHTIQQTGGGGTSGDARSRLQRTIGDGHDLTSPRFSKDVILESVYDNERLLQVGDKGPAVKKLQQALLDSGMSLPKFGADGDFGSETKAAVQAFQHAEGLTGKDIDGVVGPTTMGWLDQNFAAGPTPVGTTPAATTGCPSIKTVSVDLVSLDGSTRSPFVDLERANTILNQCCVHLSFGGGGSLGPARTAALLGGDTDLALTFCGRATAEESGLMAGAKADLGLSSRIHTFFVATATLNGGGYPSFSMPPYCSTGAAAPLVNMAVITNSASVRGLAHEIGHILLNSGTHPADPLNLMSSVSAPPGEQLTAAQRATILANA